MIRFAGKPQRYAARQATALSCAMALAIGMAGCGPRGSGGGAGGNVLRYALQTQPTQIDPARVEDGDTIDLLQQIFEGLVKWNEKNEVVPNLAEKWDVSADGRTYTFHLKEGVKFHNGRQLTAADFVYSLTRVLDPKTNSPTAMTYLNDIAGAADLKAGKTSALAGVRAVDDRTLQITIDKPRSYFLAKLTYPTGYVVCREAIKPASGGFDETSMIGTGPFKVQSYKSGYKVVLIANPDYHDGRPVLDGIERPILTDTTARQTAYESGSTDFTDIQRPDLPRIEQDTRLKSELKEFNRANIYYLAMNQQAFPPFRDKRVRQAFACAINKDALIRIALKGTAVKAGGILPPGVPGYDSGFKGIEFNPQKARELLAKAGYPNGKGFPKLTISFRQGWQHIADGVQAIRSDLKQNLGIDVDTRQVEWAQFLRERNNGTMPCYHLRWAADYPDPQNFLSLMLRTGAPENSIGYHNPQFDSLCDQADVERDPARRRTLYHDAERIAVDDAPWACLYYLPDIELHKPYVRGIRDGLLGHLPHTTTTVKR